MTGLSPLSDCTGLSLLFLTNINKELHKNMSSVALIYGGKGERHTQSQSVLMCNDNRFFDHMMLRNVSPLLLLVLV